MPIATKWSFDDPSIAFNSSIIEIENKVQVNYPCKDSTKCTSVQMLLPRGKYLFELAAGSGHIAPKFFIQGEHPIDSPHSGGYVSGIMTLKQQTNIILNIGGKGTPSIGGFNGGGNAFGPYPFSGGGGTDLRLGKNDPFHRVLVAGGGGGSDDQEFPTLESNDGNGGCGGGLQSQSFFISNSYISGFEATQTSGFSFFQGESGKATGTSHPKGYNSSLLYMEHAGAGGGWFGGFSSHHCNGGASGGSSFALTSNAIIPTGILHIYDKNYNSIEEGIYAFDPISSPYLFTHVTHRRGIWNGNGFAIITLISSLKQNNCLSHCFNTNFAHISYSLYVQILFLSQ